MLRLLLVGAVLGAAPASAGEGERLLIQAARPYEGLKARIAQLGGRVTHEYKYLDAVAAEVPAEAMGALAAIVGDSAISKDAVIANPAPVSMPDRPGFEARGPVEEVSYDAVELIEPGELARLAANQPGAYLINNAIMGTSVLHGLGRTGRGMIVGVIDSGIRPGFPHLDLDGSVVGCEDFVGDGLGCSNPANGGHGTFVAGMISANVAFSFGPTSSFRNAVLAHCPECFVDPDQTVVPMIGSAPEAGIYAFRVFGPTGGSPTSRILMAVERLIELKEKFDAGEPDGVDIQVANMSLGGPTLVAGFDMFDRAVGAMTRKGIVPVVAAGNAGPSSLTVGSPGTSLGVITVGAASHAHNERILMEAQLGPGFGALWRPFDATQMAYFSGRGPNANGFSDPDVVANGFACFGQGFSTSTLGITIGSGTSFATPSVAGVAAILRQAFPDASPSKIRNAILAAADPRLLRDDPTELDQGHGFVDAFAAYNRLASGRVPKKHEFHKPPTHSVAWNVLRGTDLRVHGGDVRKHVRKLRPGERHDILYQVKPNTEKVFVTLSGLEPQLPPSEQNQLFGDDILLAIHSAKTSAIGEGDYEFIGFVTGANVVIDDPEPGLLRVTVSGDWTNAGKVSADVRISSSREPLHGLTAHGRMREGDVAIFPIEVPDGVQEAEFRLRWERDWSHYPTSDLDLVIIDPAFATILDGSTLDSPELVRIANPAKGTWYVLVLGFEVNAWKERFKLRVALDDRVVH